MFAWSWAVDLIVLLSHSLRILHVLALSCLLYFKDLPTSPRSSNSDEDLSLFTDMPLEGVCLNAVECPFTERQLQWLANTLEVDSLVTDLYHPELYLKTRQLCQGLRSNEADL